MRSMVEGLALTPAPALTLPPAAPGGPLPLPKWERGIENRTKPSPFRGEGGAKPKAWEGEGMASARRSRVEV